MTTKVGVLVVHGIGEQKKFETVEEIVRDMATALKANENLKVKIIVNEENTGAYGASQQTWQADDKEPIIIEVEDENNQVTELKFSEVWWADLGDPVSLQSQLSFWGWGLSLWSRKQDTDLELGNNQKLEHPRNIKGKQPKMDAWGRLRFFWVSLVILLVLPVLSFLSVILRKLLGFDLRPDILVQYLGDIKLYQEGKRQGKGPLIDLGKPPRIPIRRRMIKGLVEMGLRDYDRWYVLSHSLGTIVAFNGLMTTEEVIAEYLNQSQIISRADLFKNLQGFVTYGSPLSKFGVVWPAIVPINKNSSVFNDKFEWLNVYDPTDPVAGRTALFNFTTSGNKQQPQEIAYKAEGIHLLSHVEYLNFNPSRKTPLITQLAYWILEGDNFQPGNPSLGWPQKSVIRIYNTIRILIWVVAAVLISWVLSFFVEYALPDSMEATLRDIPYLDLGNPLTYIVLGIIIVFIVGVIMRVFKLNTNSK